MPGLIGSPGAIGTRSGGGAAAELGLPEAVEEPLGPARLVRLRHNRSLIPNRCTKHKRCAGAEEGGAAEGRILPADDDLTGVS